MAERHKRTQRSVAVVIRSPGSSDRVLAVLRPSDDPELPDIWGLPAATLRPGESWKPAARRAGLEKLGVVLAELREIHRGSAERSGRTLEMRVYEARGPRGTPEVPQPHPGVTQYREWKWADPREFRAGARAGSLCCRLFLEWADR
ncbi:MAG: NUDIX hydrolase [Gemmatimonadetes bacterium]|nr:NUDIX hydrolase [Gemmatimonadota bacterium]